MELKKRGDLIYAHEIEEGDVFCVTMNDFRGGISCTCDSNTMEDKGFGSWEGEMTATKKVYSKKFGKEISKEFKTKKHNQQLIFLKRNESN